MLLSVGVQIHANTASPFLIVMLHKFGMNASSKQVRDFLRCAVMHENEALYMKHADNALYSTDGVNIQMNTLTGEGSFNDMGLICATQASTYERSKINCKNTGYSRRNP